LKGLHNRFLDTGSWWFGSFVFTKNFLSSLQILFVTDNTSVLLGGKFLEDAFRFAVDLEQFLVEDLLVRLLEDISEKAQKCKL
jgi:hypothetical protein